MKNVTWNKLRLTLCLISIAVIVASVPTYREVLRNVEKITSTDWIVIDAGHGGFDGGASSANGVPEKDINLAIAKKVEKMALADGWNVTMTRSEDVSLNKSEKGAIRSKKTSDLLERKRIISEVAPIATVSIHLNSFTADRSVHGAQVFFPSGSENNSVISESKRLAEIVQEQLINEINDGTERTALSKNGVLILKNPKTPIVIVECGFLSNYEEAKMLQSSEYQEKLAKSIYNGIMIFADKEGKSKLKLIDSQSGNMGL
ncbi:N-acetylmuramoyl-L-alanine amidase [Clostridium aminobutyricum]|uniref:N-acetylmuramoyl-L-alanine amidase n=1 Tax=Clostridium aminobutyricum TaxID=33953 RepID=A0A939D7N2_CLOAM|nr:N-acetylmuramoyl-L-alanine amidase [Clostridium aminobutyricum]MBN7773019.1 N-acetylmuramoyl-L-alanine amidase [Clostridium aminobutyricum]